MAKKPEKKKKKPSRNVLVIGETIKKSVGRGKNKTTVTQTKPVRKGLGTRLYCVLEPGSEKRGKKARFTCYGSYEDAAVSMLSRAPSKGAFSPAALKAMEELESRKPGGAFSAQALAEMEKSMKGLRGRHALPARGLRGTPEEHWIRSQNLEFVRRAADEANDNALAAGDQEAARALDVLANSLYFAKRENDRWADHAYAERLLEPVEAWSSLTAEDDARIEKYNPSKKVRGALEHARKTFIYRG